MSNEAYAAQNNWCFKAPVLKFKSVNILQNQYINYVDIFNTDGWTKHHWSRGVLPFLALLSKAEG
jgi:hypothetical protein